MSLETSHVLFFKHISLQWLSIINNILTISLLNVIWFFHVQYRSCIVHLYRKAFKLLTIKTFENMCLSSWIEHICYTIDNGDSQISNTLWRVKTPGCGWRFWYHHCLCCTFLQYFLVILKLTLQNNLKILKKCFFSNCIKR